MGHAVRVTDEREVPLVIHELLGDRKIAKAAHPAIFAYRIAKEVGGPAGKVYNTGQSTTLRYTEITDGKITTTMGRVRRVRG